MGLILGLLAVIAGFLGIKYSVIAIAAGITAMLTFFGIKRD